LSCALSNEDEDDGTGDITEPPRRH